MATQQPEAKITKKVIDRLKEFGHARKVHQGRYQTGEPDVDACIEGRAIKIEVKVPGNKPTDNQYAVMRRWERSGALVGWVTSVEAVDKLLERLDTPGWRNPQLAKAT